MLETQSNELNFVERKGLVSKEDYTSIFSIRELIKKTCLFLDEKLLSFRQSPKYLTEGKSFTTIKIDIIINKRLGSTIASACYFRKTNRAEIEFSPELWKWMLPEDRKETIIHELCHIIEFFIRGNSDHRKFWKYLMSVCGYDNASPFGKVNVPDTVKLPSVQKVLMKCYCKTWKISKTLFTRIKNGKSRRLICNSCDGYLLNI